MGPLAPVCVVRGQYRGYRNEDGVASPAQSSASCRKNVRGDRMRVGIRAILNRPQPREAR